MSRFIIYDPMSDTFVRMDKGGWTSGHQAGDVNSYATLEEARSHVRPFDSLKRCQIVEVEKTVEVLKYWELV